jgi:hypothetical protein
LFWKIVSTSERWMALPFTVATVFASCAFWQPAQRASATASHASLNLRLGKSAPHVLDESD